VVLRLRHRWLNNAFLTIAVVRLQPVGHGTRVEVTLRSYYLVAAFMTLWLGLVVLFNIVVLSATLGGSGHIEDLVLTLAFLAFGFAFVAVGRLLARPDAPALLDFIRQTTGGQDMGPELLSWPA
jgi:positive regulator of sigma E activity